uniref:Uncharacterized protein n=1 Tax=Oncorhynchus mykiss TaxID=8022 RepID=A0A8C7SPP9_ONCMY
AGTLNSDPDQFTDVVSRLQSKQLFQSDWDIASFAVFFIFIDLLVPIARSQICCLVSDL